MEVDAWSSDNELNHNFRIVFEDADIEALEEKGSVYTDLVLGDNRRISIKIVSEDKIPRLSPLNRPKPEKEEIFDSALDALMVLSMAYEDLERRIEDNESYPESHSMDYSSIIQSVRKEYEVEEAIETYIYYTKMLRQMD
jgi:hypothetical protein